MSAYLFPVSSRTPGANIGNNHSMTRFLFAYGTLQPGLVPPELSPLMAGIPVIASGSVRGTLYDLRGHPGAILDPHAKTQIRGVIYNLPDDPAVLVQLDAYEEFDPAAPGQSLFRRILHPVTTGNNGDLPCWIYVYNRRPGKAPVIASGRYRPEDRKRS